MNSSASGTGLQIVPSISTIRESQEFLAKYFAPTRLIAAPFLSKTTGKGVYLKLEMELPTASFKVRGAYWALAQRMKKGLIREVVACSTGNHGAAVGPTAKKIGIGARKFFPAKCNAGKGGRLGAPGGPLEERGSSGAGSAF